MKHLRKLMALVIAMVMMVALSSAAFAATITVTNVKKGETYKAYKILEYKSNADQTAYSYYLDAANEKSAALKTILVSAGFSFTTSADGSQYVLDETEMTADQIVAKLKEAGLTSSNVLAYAEATATADGEAVFSNLDTGYWFVTSTMGSLCAIASYNDQELIVEKNTQTTPDKKQGTETGQYSNDQLDVMIGSTVYYDVELTIGKGANYELTGTDTLSTGLTLNHADGDITVKVGTTDVAADNYTLTATDSGFTIKFKADYISSLNEGDIIKIEYSATVNENAVIRGDNKNTFDLDYSKQHFDDNTVVKTYDAQVKKVDGKKEFLAGAGFKLYDAATGGNQIKVSKDDTGYYVDPDGNAATEIMIESADGANVRGLAPGTYYLEETTVPDGYNKLDARVAVTVTKDATAAVEIEVTNEAGSVLPSTGGSGTVIFTVVGAILVLGAGLLLVARRRMNVQ